MDSLFLVSTFCKEPIELSDFDLLCLKSYLDFKKAVKNKSGKHSYVNNTYEYITKIIINSGSLALWSRLKYPHLIDGAVSASAPLTAQLDFSGNFENLKVF